VPSRPPRCCGAAVTRPPALLRADPLLLLLTCEVVVLDPLYTAVAWVLARWHDLFSVVLDPAGGATWTAAIVLLVLTVRGLLLPLFLRQQSSQRAAQLLQPEVEELRRRHGSDRAGFALAVRELQRERGVSPLAGCLPGLLQVPVFLALFHVLRRLAPGRPGRYGWDDALTDQAARAELFGAPISASWTGHGPAGEAARHLAALGDVRVVSTVLVLALCAVTYLGQRAALRRSGPATGQAATVQRVLLYGAPAGFLLTGFVLPIGVLVYWTTNSLVTWAQQRLGPPAPPPVAPAAV
jgi:YidC/Oxa1 family membrane protein insertase